MPSVGVDADPLSSYFSRLNPFDQYNVKPQGVAPTVHEPGLPRSTGPGVHTTTAPLWHPDNPLFWFGVVLAATFGLAGVSVATRVGPAHASASLGESK